LNLTLPVDEPDLSDDQRARQHRMAQLFQKDSWWRGRVDGADRDEVTLAVSDQLEEFRRLFGEPAHVNGHHHVHVTDVVLDVLPRAIPIRQVPTSPGRLRKRDARAKLVSREFRAPSATLDIANVHPALGGQGLELFEDPYVQQLTLEIVTHPQWDDQRAALLGAPWRDAVAQAGTMTFDELR
jgi:predicted glycoside hydrolase/deacetylase ChbG (UPF0249 family)